MEQDKKDKDEKYCPECGVIEGSEPFGVPCPLPECPRKNKKIYD